MNHNSWLIKRVIPFLCIAILMFCFSTTVSAAEFEQITYDSCLQAFEDTLSGDALIEEKALVLSELFYQNPSIF